MNDKFFSKKILIAITISILFHFYFLFFFSKEKKNIEIIKYTVIDLASFKKFNNPEVKKMISKPPLAKSKLEKKKVIKPKLAKKIIQKKNIKSTPKKPKTKEVKEVKKTDLVRKSNLIKKRKKDENIQKSFDFEKSQLKKNTEILINQSMVLYLKKISNEINQIANNAYPKQAVRRRLQGKIITRIKINLNGEILNIYSVTKKPKILVKATKILLEKKKKLTAPPPILFQKNKTITLEIPVNYLIK